MSVIWKFPLMLTDEQTVDMPAGASVLSVADQNHVLTMWALVEPSAPLAPVGVRILGTGNPAPSDQASWTFVGSIHQSAFVWHVFTGRPS